MSKPLQDPQLLVNLLVIVLNPWWWIIIQRNLLAGLLIFALSLVSVYFFTKKITKIILLLFLVFTLILVLISAKGAFDESIFSKSALDTQQINKRHEFYARELGKIYTNRFSITYFKQYSSSLYKLQSNFFANLDPNLYFFASHPREQLGVEEFEKYLPIFLPFFLLGLFYSLYKPVSKFLIYAVCILLVSSVISPKYNLGPLLVFPIINFMITIGIIQCRDFFRRVI